MNNWIDCDMPYWAPLEDEPYLHDEVSAEFGEHISYAGVEAALVNNWGKDMQDGDVITVALHRLLSDIAEFVSEHPETIAWKQRGFCGLHPGAEFRLADGREMVEGSVMSKTVHSDVRVIAYREIK